MINVELFKCWDYPSLYIDAIVWINRNPDICIDKFSGFSYINGSMYYNTISFNNVEDALAFKLKFIDLVKFK